MAGPPFSPRFESYLQTQERIEDRHWWHTRKAAEPKRPTLPPENIYYIRHGDLIKIGFSSDLLGRLKSYGPTITVLAHHAGTRVDERDLHRSFRPLLAYGHEWYQPGAILLDHIARMVRLHGEPWCIPTWTQPKAAPTTERRSARAKRTGLSI